MLRMALSVLNLISSMDSQFVYLTIVQTMNKRSVVSLLNHAYVLNHTYVLSDQLLIISRQIYTNRSNSVPPPRSGNEYNI